MGQVSARTHNTSAQISATTAKSLPVNFQFFMDTLASLLAFHKVEREVFRRLIDMGLNPQVARNIICLWLWLEEIGFYDMVRQISIQSNEFLALVAAEAEAAFTFIEPDGMAPTAYVRLPLTSQLANTPLSLNYFSLVKRDAFHGVSNTLNRVGNIIFNDILEERGRVDTGNGGAMAGAQAEMTSASAAQLMGRTQVWPFGEGTNGLGSGGIGNTGLFEVSGLFGMPTTGDGRQLLPFPPPQERRDWQVGCCL
uniref:Uncharacterized protein n=1 Tax=Nelumbo nucifera TaxID=4432 RepID=A0A822ZR35_NELNU|nr:TPA_asm: hypothetical protein HUJ06_017639 [Nelumbo nucifera]